MRGRRNGALVIAMAAILFSAGCGDGEDGASDTTTVPIPTTTSARATPPETAPVTVEVDGEPVELARVCEGFDGAVVATTVRGRRIILVREEGLAIRLSTDGDMFAETARVEMEETPSGTRYSGSVGVAGRDTTVEIDVPSSIALAPCPEGSSAG